MGLTLFDNLLPITPKPAEEPQPKQEFMIDANGNNVPVRILYEARFNNRVTVNKNGILLRISDKQTKEEQRKHIDTLLKWAKQKLGDKPELLESLPQRTYTNGEVLKIGIHEFVISIYYHDGTKSTAKVYRNNIVLSLAKGLLPEVQANTCSYLVSKCVAKHFTPIITERLHELNNRFIKKPVQSVKMKYATSFWGHCSHHGNIVISTRLMFAPSWVVDYVLIHELAHLVHHDHSPNFWKLVELLVPDYRNAEQHLRDHSNRYYL